MTESQSWARILACQSEYTKSSTSRSRRLILTDRDSCIVSRYGGQHYSFVLSTMCLSVFYHSDTHTQIKRPEETLRKGCVSYHREMEVHKRPQVPHDACVWAAETAERQKEYERRWRCLCLLSRWDRKRTVREKDRMTISRNELSAG